MSADRATSPARPAPWAFAAPWGASGYVTDLGPQLAEGRRAAARNPRWETVILPAVGHTPQLEAPDTVVGTMRDWLGRHFAPAIV